MDPWAGKVLKQWRKGDERRAQRPPPSLEPARLRGSVQLEINQLSSQCYK